LRAPTFLGALGVPLIIGPIGGGETSPKLLRDRLPLRGRLLEMLRDLSNATIEANPVVRQGLHRAAIIFARTADTRNVLSPALRNKTSVLMELGIAREQVGCPRARRESPRRLLYAGRLLYWKGLHIAIEAMAELVKRMPDAHLTVVGNGPDKGRFQADAARRNLGANIEFVSRMPQDEFFRLYDSHDVLLFPSLHDSEGWVVLEALCHGMPVACLDLGGPKDIVTPRSGVVVGTSGLTTSEVAATLADQLYDLLSSPTQMERLSAGAIERSMDFILSDRVTQLYDEAQRVILGGSTSLPRQPRISMAGPPEVSA
jgi:glycosyltransferase involved in cell wall biosynthesis